MTHFFLRRNDHELGPYRATELHQAGVDPDDGIRHGVEDPWRSFSELLHRNTAARVELQEGLPPETQLSLDRRSILEYSWPAMLLAVDALWLGTAALRHQSPAGWATAAMLLTTMAITVAGLVRRQPWAWFMSALLCGAMASWMLAPLVAAPTSNLLLWCVINISAVGLLALRRPRGPALDWPRAQRQLLGHYSVNPAQEARNFHRRRGAVPWPTGLASVAAFWGLACALVYVFHRLKYPGLDLPLGLMPRGADWTGRLLALGIYGTMVGVALAATRLHGLSPSALGLGSGLGWRHSLWTGFRVCLALLVILLASRWLMRAVEVVELRGRDPAVSAPQDTATGQVRAALDETLDRRVRRERIWHDLWVLFVALLVGPVCEEVFFRGLLFGALRRSWPFWAAALASSLVFALTHGWGAGWGLAGPVLWVQIAAGGLAAAYAYELTGSIMAPVFLHVVWNGAQAAVDVVAT